eukprot:Colp12_sorted_trinity150504_noHs@8816
MLRSRTLLLVLLCSSCMVVYGSKPWDFFVFSRFYVGSSCDLNFVCKFEAGAPPKDPFQVHGLWPSQEDGGFPSRCGNNTFERASLDPIAGELNEVWVDTVNADNADFWASEWRKHGPCSQPTLNSELEYFTAVVRLTKTFSLATAFATNGVTPRMQPYSSDTLQPCNFPQSYIDHWAPQLACAEEILLPPLP